MSKSDVDVANPIMKNKVDVANPIMKNKKSESITKREDVKVYSTKGNVVEILQLAPQMQEQKIKRENIKRAILYEQRLTFQPQGRDIMAGMRCSSRMHVRAQKSYRSKKNKGISRIARNPFTYKGVQATNVRGGSHRHKPLANKHIEWLMPKKESLKAMRAALTLSTNIDEVMARGHKVNKEFKLPLVFDMSICDIKKTADFVNFLKEAGFSEELERTKYKKIRVGKGKMRGRTYIRKRGVVVISEKTISACENIPGVENYSTEELIIQDVFPGANHPRLIIWCVDSYKKLIEEKIYVA